MIQTSSPYIEYKLPKEKAIKKVLIIRLQAMGDVVIMLPYIQNLKEKLPANTTIDLLTRKETESIPKHINLFNHVYSIGGGRNTKLQLLSFLLLYPILLFKGYDVVFDLQNNNLTKVIRFLLGIKAYSLFDRVSPNYAGDRYKNTINILGIAQVQFKKLNTGKESNKLLTEYNLTKRHFIVINPAGAFENRNWALDNYVQFCKLWAEKYNTLFVILGITKIKHKADYLKEKLGQSAIDLVDKTTPYQAMQVLQNAKLVLSEDSGLLHMSYAVGTPTVGILGSTRNDWTNPNLPHTHFFNSADLPCGNCMLAQCKFEETICLTRLKPQHVLDAAITLLESRRF
ncbi:MAG TPA: glycosyltransferase family 9 protein [Bacteroidia bacterium]|nr:glycosyltransferase family 9 protein [Bacteroidia bacterium]